MQKKCKTKILRNFSVPSRFIFTYFLIRKENDEEKEPRSFEAGSLAR